jgi:hypothetical protein
MIILWQYVLLTFQHEEFASAGVLVLIIVDVVALVATYKYPVSL